MDEATQRLLCEISDDLCRAIIAAETDRIENVEGILAGINDRIIEGLRPYGHADDREPFGAALLLEKGLPWSVQCAHMQTLFQRENEQLRTRLAAAERERDTLRKVLTIAADKVGFLYGKYIAEEAFWVDVGEIIVDSLWESRLVEADTVLSRVLITLPTDGPDPK